LQAQKTLVDIAVGSKEHTTLVTAVTAASLVETLQGKGPFTVFAPVNAAFTKLPEGTVTTLLKAENKATLTKVLTYHVVAGNLDAAAVVKAITDGGGKVEVTTVSGGKLMVSLKDGKVILTDENGGVATVLVTDLKADNGVIHVIDSVVLPK
ncbi:MAG: fasciclin domain-containing protein, partial [Bacteroidota bacterium]